MTLLETLGYSRSATFIRPDQLQQLPANELVFALRLADQKCQTLSAETAAGQFQGAYVLQREANSPATPVIYLVQVASDAAARRVHQFVWNQNQTPFLIVESPSTVRVYPGFSFDRDTDRPLCEVAQGAADLLEQLSAFRAESIDDGSLWKEWAHAVDPSQRVDEALLRDLRVLDQRLQHHDGMDRTASHALIGKFVYLKYLRHRGILSNKKLAKWEIDPDHLFTDRATLKAFQKVNEELQDWLNGSVFSLGDGAAVKPTATQLKLVAGVFAGDSPVGMKSLQKSLFSSYDFSDIPIETLSCVYEQFLHDAKEEDGSSRGKTLGAYYTPLPLADYVLSEMENRRPLQVGMTVLDPACGSGSFLVQCYRRLIERQRRLEGRELKATELRDLLTKHIFGIDRDDDACRVAELSLIMTLLDYIDLPDLEHTNFKLPTLRDQNIVQGDFFDESGAAFNLLSDRRFDWIVGNPPWSEVNKTPASDHEHYTAHQWMQRNKKTHPTSGNQIAEAFLWKAGDHLATDGICGLVVLAMTWFKSEATLFRQRFFTERRVWCLANFANLAYVLFAGRSQRPASVVFFSNQQPGPDHVVLTFAPFVAEQIANRPEEASKQADTWNIVVSRSDVREVDLSSATTGDGLTWKLAMWGTPRDKKLLERLAARFKDERIDSLKLLGIAEPHEGFQLRNKMNEEKKEQAETLELPGGEKKKDPLKPCPELEGKKILNIAKLRNTGRIFAFPDSAIESIKAEDCFIRLRGGLSGLEVSKPPHIVIDASRRFAVFSDEFIAIPPRQIGVAGRPESTTHLRALSLLLSSDFCTYHQFFHSPQWGIDASRADLKALLIFPSPLARLTAGELREWAELQRELTSGSLEVRVGASLYDEENINAGQANHEATTLIAELNNRVSKLLGLRKVERWLIQDFVHFNLELNKGKVTPEAIRSPTADECQTYLLALRDCLDGFLSDDRGVRHKLEVLTDRDSALISVALVRSTVSIKTTIINADDPASRSLKTIRDRLRSKHSQWVYFDRGLKIYEPKQGTLYQFKPLQRLHWTRRQAVLDADDIIAETLSEGGVP